MIRKGLVFVIILLFFGAGVIPSYGGTITEKEYIKLVSNGNTLYVGGSGPGNYTKIQDAIDNSSDGDTVFVFDDLSPYFENVNVNKIINLKGEDKETTIIDGGGTGDVISIASGVNISSFTIQNSGTDLHHDAGIEVGKNCVIFDNIIKNNWKGIYMYHDHGNIIKNNNISENTIGVYLMGSDYNTIIYNSIANNNIGVNYDCEVGSVSANCNNNYIIKNNFINNERHARFFHFLIQDESIPLNIWDQNYWDQPRNIPKIIFGFHTFIPWINIDWRPAQKPYDIEEVKQV